MKRDQINVRLDEETVREIGRLLVLDPELTLSSVVRLAIGFGLPVVRTRAENAADLEFENKNRGKQ